MSQEKEMVTAWITRYALTQGIFKVRGEVCHDITSEMLTWDTHGVAHGKDWHRTPEDAVARAEEMRKNKITSLRKSMAKLEKLTFEAPNT